MLAAERGHMLVVKDLLENGANVDLQGEVRGSVTFTWRLRVCACVHIEQIKFLSVLSVSSQVDCQDKACH